MLLVPLMVGYCECSGDDQENDEVGQDNEVEEALKARSFGDVVAEVHDLFGLGACVDHEAVQLDGTADDRAAVQELLQVDFAATFIRSLV